MAKREAHGNCGPGSSAEKELRADLLHLAKACPFDGTNPWDCPLFPLRKMKPRKRAEWFNSLSEADLVYLASYHQVCLTIQSESRTPSR
jgi:hypothetical protein